MLKKLMLIPLAAIVFCQLHAAEEKVKANQSSRESAIISFVAAISCADTDCLWELFTPENHKQLSAACKSEAEAKTVIGKAIQEKISAENSKKLRDMLEKEDERLRIVKGFMEKHSNAVVEIDGKWYIDVYKLQ